METLSKQWIEASAQSSWVYYRFGEFICDAVGAILEPKSSLDVFIELGDGKAV